jgi:hypothetical protein
MRSHASSLTVGQDSFFQGLSKATLPLFTSFVRAPARCCQDWTTVRSNTKVLYGALLSISARHDEEGDIIL